jgi:soluble lytic murein transglycosylase
MFNEETNIKFGCFYLNYLFSKFKDKDVVICAYNAGEGVVRNWINEDGSLDRSKISFDETKKYLERVNVFYDSYKSNIL